LFIILSSVSWFRYAGKPRFLCAEKTVVIVVFAGEWYNGEQRPEEQESGTI